MCELTVKIKAPYNITLIIDGEYCPADENGLFKINIEPEIKHKLEIRVDKSFSNVFSVFKLTGRHTDAFYNVLYKADFMVSKKHSIAQVSFSYNKFKTLNFELNETPVSFIEITKKYRIDISSEEKSIFRNKFDFLIYFFRHRWIEIVVAIIGTVLFSRLIFNMYVENQADLYKPFDIVRSFSSNPIEAIVELSIMLFLWMTYWISGNILFVRRSLKISKWTKDEDNKSAFLYKTKFFL